MSDVFVLTSNPPPWGDFGKILIHGMTANSPRSNGLLCLERTGPYVPPITFPSVSDIVVTDAFRQALEPQGFTGFEWRPVIKKHIVPFAWEHWDRAALEPEVYPHDGGPEDYVLSGEHSPGMADAMGELWEIALPDITGLQGDRGSINLSAYDGQDICRVNRWGRLFVSARFAAWLERHFAQWISLHPAIVNPRPLQN